MAEQKQEVKEEKKDTSTKVTVTIQYCSGCGYSAKFKAAKSLIETRFPFNDQIEIIGKCDSTKTENFEIKVNGKLIHSKQTKDDGFLHNNIEQQSILCKTINNILIGKEEIEYPHPPNGENARPDVLHNHGWGWTDIYAMYLDYMKKISVPRDIKMDDVRDGRLRFIMILLKDFGYSQEVNKIVNKIHDCFYERLMGDITTPIDIYNIGILSESIQCLQITKLESEIPKILAKDIEFINIWKTDAIGLRAHGTANLLCYLQRNEKKRWVSVMEKGMNTLQLIMTLPMDNSLWKRCASIIAGLARCMSQKEYDILTMISGNIMDELAKQTIQTFKSYVDKKDKNLIQMKKIMKTFTTFCRQDDKRALIVPKIISNRATFVGEDYTKEYIVCDGNPIVDLKVWKEFIASHNIDKKEWGFLHEMFGLQMKDMWEISAGDDQKELDTKLKNGELIIGKDVGNNYLAYLLALSSRIDPMFQKQIHDLFGDKHKAAPVKKMSRCNNKLRGKYANKPFPKAAELTDTIRCLVVFNDFKDLLNGYKKLKDNFMISRVKNGFSLDEKDVSFGYRDALINIVFDAGFCKIVCELQFTTELFFKLRGKLHRYYTFNRCEEAMEMLTPCNKWIDRLVSTIQQEKKKKEQKNKEQKKDK
eukprot:314967_1